ncbi:MAG: hypothetical protein IJJ33_05425 [Victivallales bacterium]|nr:hypothetical protein [Victivallales bacterium]
MSNERNEVELFGELGETDELCDDGSSALSLMTPEGDEYIICNRKIVRRLMKYAEAQVEITLRGYVRHDPSGIEILSVTGYDAPQLDDDSDYNYGDSEPAPRSRKHRKKVEELDEDGSLDNDDSQEDEDFDADGSMDFDGMDDEQEPTPEELAELDAALANDDLNINFEEDASASKPRKSSRKRQKK